MRINFLTKKKNVICKAPVRTFFDVNKPITLNVDASKDAVGACVLQSP